MATQKLKINTANNKWFSFIYIEKNKPLTDKNGFIIITNNSFVSKISKDSLLSTYEIPSNVDLDNL